MGKAEAPWLHGAVPVPNRLFDDVMPGLSDTQLRVLLVVLRQTLGWREGDDRGGWRHKRRDWISQGQMARRTGRGTVAVSRAVAALVDAGLVVAEDYRGRPLDTPAKRRMHIGHVYFRPGDMWIIPPSPSPHKRTTTTDTSYNKGRSRPAGGAAALPRPTGHATQFRPHGGGGWHRPA